MEEGEGKLQTLLLLPVQNWKIQPTWDLRESNQKRESHYNIICSSFQRHNKQKTTNAGLEPATSALGVPRAAIAPVGQGEALGINRVLVQSSTLLKFWEI